MSHCPSVMDFCEMMETCCCCALHITIYYKFIGVGGVERCVGWNNIWFVFLKCKRRWVRIRRERVYIPRAVSYLDRGAHIPPFSSFLYLSSTWFKIWASCDWFRCRRNHGTLLKILWSSFRTPPCRLRFVCRPRGRSSFGSSGCWLC